MHIIHLFRDRSLSRSLFQHMWASLSTIIVFSSHVFELSYSESSPLGVGAEMKWNRKELQKTWLVEWTWLLIIRNKYKKIKEKKKTILIIFYLYIQFPLDLIWTLSDKRWQVTSVSFPTLYIIGSSLGVKFNNNHLFLSV